MIENNWYYKLEIANIHQIEKALFFLAIKFYFYDHLEHGK